MAPPRSWRSSANFCRWLAPLGVPVELEPAPQDGRRKPPRAPGLTLGTHALLTAGFALPGLGLVIIDRQHKFGVAQRGGGAQRSAYPHLLVMTATPIRTLGLTLGGLDISVAR